MHGLHNATAHPEDNMDLRRMKHLVVLADTRNFSRAATRCHLSQPAFSRSVQAAEEELGLKLFDRNAMDVTCTDAGTFFVERARRLVFDSRCLERDVSLYRERLLGDLAFGVGPYPAATMLPGLLLELRTRFPGINTRVEVNNAKYLEEHLRAEELDFFLSNISLVPNAPDLTLTPIGRLSAGFYARPGHPLLALDKAKAAALLPYGIASVRVPESVLASLGTLMGLEHGKLMPLAVECDDLSLLKTIAMTTDTLLACPDAGAVQEVQGGRLIRLEVRDMPPMFNEMGLFALKGRSHSPMAQFAVEYFIRAGAEQAAA
jgi:DNA-binding transcriptional LysR family regulator